MVRRCCLTLATGTFLSVQLIRLFYRSFKHNGKYSKILCQTKRPRILLQQEDCEGMHATKGCFKVSIVRGIERNFLTCHSVELAV